MLLAASHADRRREAWFRTRPRLAVWVAAVLYAGVFVLRWAVPGAEGGPDVLFVLPVALLAFAFGLRVGVGAGLVAVGLLVAGAVVDASDLSAVGWLGRGVPLLLLGALVGRAADREREAAEVRRRLLAAELRERDAAEINDSILQGLAVAKWSIEVGRYERSLEILTETIETGQGLVASLLAGAPPGPERSARR